MSQTIESMSVELSSSASTPVGVLVIGRKRPGFDMEWNQIMRRSALEALKEEGFTAIGAETPVLDDQTVRDAIARIREAGCDTLLVLQPSLGNGQVAFAVMQNWDGPVVLWATPERQEAPKVSSCSLVAQHLWASIFRHSSRAFEFVYGDPSDELVQQSLRKALLVSAIPKLLKRTKAGLVGSHAPGFIPMHADPFSLQTKLGVQLQSLSLPQFIDRTKTVDEDRLAEDVNKAREWNFANEDLSDAELQMDSRYYLAMRDLIEEEQLDALAVQCWPELSSNQWPYLAMTRLTNEGLIVSMEGDVDGALTCLIGKQMEAGVGFITDWLEHDEKTITFWHPGVAPLSLCYPAGSKKGPSLGRHFNIAKAAVVDGPLKADLPVTIARLWRCDGHYHVTALEGNTISPRRELTGNAGLVNVDGVNVNEWFEEALHAGLPHHVIVFGGHHADSFRRLARMMKLNWFSVK
ncbi:MAG TPA: hypothetical protein VF669_01720 [Tepidisphaeraceae bacterium]|jgi:L-fucose isomerase-like protein